MLKFKFSSSDSLKCSRQESFAIIRSEVSIGIEEVLFGMSFFPKIQFSSGLLGCICKHVLRTSFLLLPAEGNSALVNSFSSGRGCVVVWCGSLAAGIVWFWQRCSFSFRKLSLWFKCCFYTMEQQGRSDATSLLVRSHETAVMGVMKNSFSYILRGSVVLSKGCMNV